MILYHGTSLEKGKQIIEDGVIKANIKRNYIGEIAPTTDGYVYLTTNLHTAFYYGNITISGIDDYNKKYVCIFKIDVEEELLLPDFDEINVICRTPDKEVDTNTTFTKSIQLCGCVTVNRDINIQSSDYIILPGVANLKEDEDNVMLCRELSKLQLYGGNIQEVTDKVQERFKWKEVSNYAHTCNR